MKRFCRTAVIALALLGLGGAAWLAWRLWVEDGPPLRWVLYRGNIQSVILRWDGKEIPFTDDGMIDRFYRAVVAGKDPQPFPTKCLPNDPADWKNWSVTFIQRAGAPFEVNLGLDDCGAFYCPSIGSTYESDTLTPLVKEVAASHEQK